MIERQREWPKEANDHVKRVNISDLCTSASLPRFPPNDNIYVVLVHGSRWSAYFINRNGLEGGGNQPLMYDPVSWEARQMTRQVEVKGGKIDFFDLPVILDNEGTANSLGTQQRPNFGGHRRGKKAFDAAWAMGSCKRGRSIRIISHELS
ncbi:uncharacterized protein EI90DRAFT_2612711 [Cantharellus anzutake]|uniref:uncharacterized protein n=1 Tax=Cantharellus anzutake TaxID=1750568 RepID=UPI0019071935|nr:uncharacterized protein EI90DRAFT_2612711 [Cantharellus anzutake]KAF8320171.1 hypothetical protein EI90DRAFT_2612711 [Cantharellus anzutake]